MQNIDVSPEYEVVQYDLIRQVITQVNSMLHCVIIENEAGAR